MNSVGECLNALKEANEDWYSLAINDPKLAKPFARLVLIAGQRDELLTGAERWLLLDEAKGEARDHIQRLVERHTQRG